MKNPTRKEVELLKLSAWWWQGGDQRRMCDFALRALDMREEIGELLEAHIGKGTVLIDGQKLWLAGKLYETVRKFDGASDATP